jgi:WD40 repeat protein
VNTLALNTDYALRIGPFDQHGKREQTKEESCAAAVKRYQDVLTVSGGVEKMISGSDDFTMFMWEPTRNKKPIARMTGHQGLINVVAFSPDGRLAVSASFDKNIKLWNGSTGKLVQKKRKKEFILLFCFWIETLFFLSLKIHLLVYWTRGGCVSSVLVARQPIARQWKSRFDPEVLGFQDQETEARSSRTRR